MSDKYVRLQINRDLVKKLFILNIKVKENNTAQEIKLIFHCQPWRKGFPLPTYASFPVPLVCFRYWRTCKF
ncbi:hypothetical protein J6590_087077 [Homalodisca vitripennis]|nr:hypothetical protein J6590_087077 [Homalodisca vitripennis]